MAEVDYYKVLGVARTATADEIKRAYRKSARKYHPDVNTSAEADAKFKAAGEAYEVLRDPETRAAYDQYGSAWQSPPQTGPESDGGYQFRREDVTGMDDQVFRDLFGDAFGQRQGGSGMGADQHARIVLDLEDVMKGADKTLSLRMPVMAPDGQITWADQRLNVRVPKGVGPGQQIRLKGQGAQGGNLFLEVALRPHPTYRIDGRDLSMDLPVTPWEAALGGEITLPTPSGKVKMKIPRNARSGQRLRLKGRGLPGAQPGDLYAVLLIVNPPVKSAEERAIYENMAKELSFNPREKLGG